MKYTIIKDRGQWFIEIPGASKGLRDTFGPYDTFEDATRAPSEKHGQLIAA